MPAPFCGTNMGALLAHYLKIVQARSKLHRSITVNGSAPTTTQSPWPGYARTRRVLKWIFERFDGKVHAVDTTIGDSQSRDPIPRTWTFLSANIAKLLGGEVEEGWLDEIPSIGDTSQVWQPSSRRGLEREGRRTGRPVRKAKSSHSSDAEGAEKKLFFGFLEKTKGSPRF